MGAGRTRAPQKKISGKYFWANVMKNLGILLIFHTHFWAKSLAPKVDSAHTNMQNSQNHLQTNNHHDAVITIKFITYSAHYS